MGTDVFINSRRMGKLYKVSRFLEYDIDIDLEMDADQFNMIISNPDGMHTGLFNKFDTVDVKIGSDGVLHGCIDETENQSDDSGNIIRIVGRDVAGILVDNDAIPETLNNVDPSSYIERKCEEYGIKHACAKVDIVDKLIIGAGESEISIMNNLIVEQFKHIWSIYDVLYMGDWATNALPSYKFTRGVAQDQMGIPMKSIILRDSGLDMKSEVRIYGSMDDGKQKAEGIARNEYMTGQGIKRRRTIASSNNDSATKYASGALQHIRNGFKSGMVLEIKVMTKVAILPDRTALVIDLVNKINSVFFIKAVKYTKNSNGSETTITMIPGDVTFDVIWREWSASTATAKKSSIIGLPTMSLSELLASRK